MAKILVKLKENSFLDLHQNQYIMADRPYIVENSAAIQSVCASGKMEVICNTLKAEATDKILEEYLEKKDLNAFLADYDSTIKKPEPAPISNNKNNSKKNK